MIMKNGAQEDVLGVGTYQLKMYTGHNLLLHDVLHAPTIRYNLLLVISLLQLRFSFQFENSSLSIYLGSELYGYGTLKDEFFMLDLDSNNSIICVASSSSDVMFDSVK